MPSRPIRSALLVSAAIAALALSACREDERPASTAVGYGVPPSALAYDPTLAPPVDALPATTPAPVGRLVSNKNGYAWAERAYAMDRAFYDAPPDYGFAYDDVEPWVWESEDRWSMYAEPISNGYRYYYYEPGADRPYFVRDDHYGYGYDNAGRLVTLYTAAGVLLPNSYMGGRAEMAGRYWRRAQEMRQASGRAHRQRVAEERWLSRQPVFVRSQANWFNAAQQRDEWRSYRARDEARDQRRFEGERHRREAAIARLQNAELRRAEGFRENDRDGRRRTADLEQRQDRRDWRDDRRGRDDARRVQVAEAERQRAEARGQDDRRRVERDGRRQQVAQQQAERGRQDALRREQDGLRQQAIQARQAHAEQGRQDVRRQQVAQRAADARRGRQEAESRGRQEAQRQQMAQAERGRREADAQQRQAQAQQARAENDRRGREAAAQARQQQQQAQNAAQAGREAAARERQSNGNRPDRGGEHRGPRREN